MGEPDVRWEGVSHEWIVNLTSWARPDVTERLEARLISTAEALARTANLTNSVLQRVNSGEWAGNAAALAAAAMQAMRDFDDTMRHHGMMNSLAAYGQSDNVAWVKANVPPVVEVPVARIPTGGPADALDSTVDHHDQLQAAKNAEERARQVMRQYEAMTKERIAGLPPMPSVPQVVVDGGENTITVDGRLDSSGDQVLPRGDEQRGETGGDPRRGDDTGAGPATTTLPDVGLEQPDMRAPTGSEPSGGAPSDTSPAGTVGTSPAGTVGTSPAGTVGTVGTPVAGGNEVARVVRVDGLAGMPGVDADRDPLRGGQPDRPSVSTGPRIVEPRPGARTTEVVGRARGGTTGIAPVGAAGPAKSDEDKEHKARYGVPGSEIFEPDNDGGLLYDPFRPGSFVAPASIGDDDDE